MRRAREKAGLTLEQIAAGTGIPYSTVQAFESGRGGGYSIEQKGKIADFLSLPFLSLWPEELKRIEANKEIYAAIIKASK